MESLNELAGNGQVLQFISYTDDSIEVQFRDYTSIQLSPCGANFQYLKSMDGCPGVPDYQNAIRQRCRFATSETKEKVDLALTLRNSFALRPYIPAQFLHLSEKEKVHLYKDVTSFYWPGHDANDCVGSTKSDISCVSVKAQDDCATLVLNNSGNQVLVEFLAKISPCTSRTCTPSQSPRGDKISSESSGRREYVWLKNIFPSHLSPNHWSYPLNYVKSLLNGTKVDEQLLNASHAPRPLPSTCKSQFKHIWSQTQELCGQTKQELVLPDSNGEQDNSLLKVLWNNRVWYWVNYHDTPAIQAWLQDGSVLNSLSSNNYYFQYLEFSPDGKIKLERTYSPTTLPPNVQLKTVLLRCVRLLSYVEQNKTLFLINAKKKLCWHDTLSYQLSSESFLSSTSVGQPEAEASIFGLGNFYCVNGSVQVKFNDGASAYVALSTDNYDRLKVDSQALNNIPWRLRLSDGSYEASRDLLHYNTNLSTYLKPLADWLLWLSKPTEDRESHPFYSNTIYSVDKISMVSDELSKISKFNDTDQSYESESSQVPYLEMGNEPTETTNNFQIEVKSSSIDYMSPADIARALSSTKKAISDIDGALQSLKLS